MSTNVRPTRGAYDVLIIGAGFYGCALAAQLAAEGRTVLVCEMGDEAMERASAINQSRVHAGFHYPRSFTTALRSWRNFGRFTDDFEQAIVRDFQMLYAISRHRTKVNAQRFVGMFEAMGAPIRPATAAQKALFSNELVEDVFSCTEYAFNYRIIREILLRRIAHRPVEFAFGTRVTALRQTAGDHLQVQLNDKTIEAGQVFNITYSQLNNVLATSGLDPLPLKHEMVEIALVDPPIEMDKLAVTVMDGAFFSMMPYPSAGAYSLTHVRYTPHFSWTDAATPLSAYEMATKLPRESRWRHMVNDAKRFMPSIGAVSWRRSLFEVKTVPIKNESDDGRPILLHRHPQLPGLISVLGSKIDNIYDLFESIRD